MIVLCVAVWLVAWVLTARGIYICIRPAREPVYCREYVGCARGHHNDACFRKGLTDETDARLAALGGGFLWPVTLLLLAVGGVAFRRVPMFKAEGEARIARLEKELGYRD